MKPARMILSTALFAVSLATAAHAAVTISTGATKNVNCSSGVCTPTAKNANLNVGDLQTMLAASDVTVKTGAGAIAIGVLTPLAWASTHRLTLDSIEFVHIEAALVVEGTGALTLTTNDGGSGGDLVFEDGGYVNFWDLASNLVINGKSYMLVGDIKTLAGAIAANPSGNFALASDYDASVDGVYAGPPVAAQVQGTFEGLNNAIGNLAIDDTFTFDSVGLFLGIGTNGVVRDLRLENENLSNLKGDSGGLAGDNAGAITAVSVTGTIKAKRCVGGLVGGNSGTIAKASVSAKIRGVVYTGGLACANSGSIVRSSATGDVSSVADAGGLVDENEGFIDQSFATGAVTGSVRIGGLIAVDGFNSGTVTNCYALGRVTAKSVKGGVIAWAGGLVGDVEAPAGAQLATSYATGKIGGPGLQVGGGVFGVDGSKKNSDLYWDLDTSGISNPHKGAGTPRNDPGLTGLTDAQLKSAPPAGFDPNVWGQSPGINNGWPYLLANPPP